MLSTRRGTCPTRCCRSLPAIYPRRCCPCPRLPQTMLSPSQVPHTMLSPSIVAPDDVVAVQPVHGAPHDVVGRLHRPDDDGCPTPDPRPTPDGAPDDVVDVGAVPHTMLSCAREVTPHDVVAPLRAVERQRVGAPDDVVVPDQGFRPGRRAPPMNVAGSTCARSQGAPTGIAVLMASARATAPRVLMPPVPCVRAS